MPLHSLAQQPFSLFTLKKMVQKICLGQARNLIGIIRSWGRGWLLLWSWLRPVGSESVITGSNWSEHILCVFSFVAHNDTIYWMVKYSQSIAIYHTYATATHIVHGNKDILNGVEKLAKCPMTPIVDTCLGDYSTIIDPSLRKLIIYIQTLANCSKHYSCNSISSQILFSSECSY